MVNEELQIYKCFDAVSRETFINSLMEVGLDLLRLWKRTKQE